MQIYHYHPVTGEFLGEGVADESPLEPGAYLVPAHATTTAPPTAVAGKVRVWRGEWVFEDAQADQPLDPEYEPTPEDPEYEPTPEELEQLAREAFKAERQIAVDNIKVVVGGKVFDGDETSQTRMARAIVAMEEGELVQWVLANNETVMVAKAQLKEALRLAGAAQTAVWVMP